MAVSAAPPAHLFRISNVKTSQLIFSDGSEKEGDIVFTVPANQANVRNSLVTITPPLALGGAAGTTCTVKGKAGLYASIQPGPESAYLVWGKMQYEWYFLLQPSKSYYTVAIPDQDYYWNGGSGATGLYIMPEAGGTKTPEIFFKVAPV
ncbi:hypothetical protein F5887DRAFT_926175 [Amanita rubescens]|nr:hypothetical protein F5887DRAFT_926175 [Amanita rubescens]